MAKYTAEQLFDLVSNLVHEVTIGRRAESEDARTLPVKAADMSLSAIEYALRYGIQRGVNDKVGGSDLTVKAKVELAEAIIIGWYDGIVRKRRESGPVVDSFTNVARKLVLSLLSKEQRAKIVTKDESGKVHTDVEKLDAIFAKNEAKLRPQVEARLEEMRKAAELADGLDVEL